MATSSVSISAKIRGTPNGDRDIGPINLANATSPYNVQQVVLAAGTNTIYTPTITTPAGCIITLPSTNTSLVTLKGITGDTGVPIGKTGSIVLSWDSANVPVYFVLSSASTQTGLLTQIDFF